MKSIYTIIFLYILFAGVLARDIKLTPVHIIQSDTLMNTPEDIKIVNDWLFISLRGAPEEDNNYTRIHSGLAAWDIHQIDSPKFLFKFSHPALQGGMDHILVGKTLFLQSLYNATLFSLDITDITTPRLLDTLELGDDHAIAYRLFKIPNQERLVVSIRNEPQAPTGKVAVINITNPKNLQIIDEKIETNTWSYDNFATGNTVYSFPYMKGNGKLNIYELQQNGKLNFKKSFADPLIDGVHSYQKDNLLTLANFGTAAILFLDIQDPLNPRIIGKLQDDRLGEPNRIAPDHTHQLLWVAGYRKNIVSVVDISNPRQPRFIKSFEHELFDRVQTIAFHQNHLFVGSRNTNSTVIFKVDICE
ncbi:hypothetical protein KAH55_15075 [bacterium]|nr:hypothetical protein [bacterium]